MVPVCSAPALHQVQLTLHIFFHLKWLLHLMWEALQLCLLSLMSGFCLLKGRDTGCLKDAGVSRPILTSVRYLYITCLSWHSSIYWSLCEWMCVFLWNSIYSTMAHWNPDSSMCVSSSFYFQYKDNICQMYQLLYNPIQYVTMFHLILRVRILSYKQHHLFDWFIVD